MRSAAVLSFILVLIFGAGVAIAGEPNRPVYPQLASRDILGFKVGMTLHEARAHAKAAGLRLGTAWDDVDRTVCEAQRLQLIKQHQLQVGADVLPGNPGARCIDKLTYYSSDGAESIKLHFAEDVRSKPYEIRLVDIALTFPVDSSSQARDVVARAVKKYGAPTKDSFAADERYGSAYWASVPCGYMVNDPCGGNTGPWVLLSLSSGLLRLDDGVAKSAIQKARLSIEQGVKSSDTAF